MNTINISFMVEITKVSLWFTIETQQCIDHWSACSIHFLDRKTLCEKRQEYRKDVLQPETCGFISPV
jgi:hypothetical protein